MAAADHSVAVDAVVAVTEEWVRAAIGGSIVTGDSIVTVGTSAIKDTIVIGPVALRLALTGTANVLDSFARGNVMRCQVIVAPGCHTRIVIIHQRAMDTVELRRITMTGAPREPDFRKPTWR